MDEPKVSYHMRGLRFSSVKEQNIDTQSSMGELQGHYVKRKKPDTKDYTSYDSIFVNYSKKANYRDRMQISCCLEVVTGIDYKEAGGNFVGNGSTPKLHCRPWWHNCIH